MNSEIFRGTNRKKDRHSQRKKKHHKGKSVNEAPSFESKKVGGSKNSPASKNAGTLKTSRSKFEMPKAVARTQAPPSSAKTSSGFDPGAKLLEALQKKGLKPSGQLIRQEFGHGVTQKHIESGAVTRFEKKRGSKKSGSNRNKGKRR